MTNAATTQANAEAANDQGAGEAAGDASTTTATATGTAEQGSATDGDAGTTNTEAFDPDRAQRTIQAQRASEAAALARAKAAEDRVKELEQAQLSEEERREQARKDLETKTTQLERENRELKVGGAFREAALAAGVRPEAIKAASALVDLQVDDESGQITNLDDAIATLQAEHAYLLVKDGQGSTKVPPREGTTNAGAGSGNDTGDGVTLTPIQIELAARSGMTPEQYAKQLDS